MDGYRCNCARCRSHGMMAPVVLITLGILFLLSQFYYVSFSRTWPVLLIAIGLVKVWQSTTSNEGHMQYAVMPPASQVPAVPPADANSGQVHNG